MPYIEDRVAALEGEHRMVKEELEKLREASAFGEVLSVSDFCKLFQLPLRTARQIIKDIPHAKLGKQIRILRADAMEYFFSKRRASDEQIDIEASTFLMKKNADQRQTR